jgi:hypothetical protein
LFVLRKYPSPWKSRWKGVGLLGFETQTTSPFDFVVQWKESLLFPSSAAWVSTCPSGWIDILLFLFQTSRWKFFSNLGGEKNHPGSPSCSLCGKSVEKKVESRLETGKGKDGTFP